MSKDFLKMVFSKNKEKKVDNQMKEIELKLGKHLAAMVHETLAKHNKDMSKEDKKVAKKKMLEALNVLQELAAMGIVGTCAFWCPEPEQEGGSFPTVLLGSKNPAILSTLIAVLVGVVRENAGENQIHYPVIEAIERAMREFTKKA